MYRWKTGRRTAKAIEREYDSLVGIVLRDPKESDQRASFDKGSSGTYGDLSQTGLDDRDITRQHAWQRPSEDHHGEGLWQSKQQTGEAHSCDADEDDRTTTEATVGNAQQGKLVAGSSFLLSTRRTDSDKLPQR
jgi:hypothetical protein